MGRTDESRNDFLLQIGLLARKYHKRYWDDHNYSVRISKRYGQPEVGLWFRTSYGQCNLSSLRHEIPLSSAVGASLDKIAELWDFEAVKELMEIDCQCKKL